MKNYDAVVIGSGIGGLAITALLAHAGKKVIVLEKNDQAGGRLGSYEKDGFMVDFGVHVISRGAKGPVAQCLERCGFPDAIPYTNVRPITRYKGEDFKFPHDLKKFAPEEDFNGLMKFIQDLYAMSPEDMEAIDGITLDDYLDRYTKDPIIHSTVTTIAFVYCAVPGWSVSAGEFARCLVWEATSRSSGYPEGGCVAITRAYVNAIEKLGGEIILNAPAEKILIEDKKAVGVIANGEEYRAPIIISNADIKLTALKLVGEEYYPSEYIDKVKNVEYSYAGPSIKIALDAPFTELKMFSQSPDLTNAEYYAQIRNGVLPEVPFLFFVCSSNFSKGIAPEGKQLWTVATPIPCDTSPAVLDQVKDRILESLDKLAPGYRDHVLWIDTMSIHAMDQYAYEEGATIGMGQIVGQVGKDRLGQKTPIEGLYQVGGEAGGAGVGIELATNSAIDLFDSYLK